MINKNSLKFVGVFALVIIAVLTALYYVNYYFSPEQKALRYYAELERQYAEDTYGGKTPEETLQLFIDALKAGDIELASKYFVPDERENRFNKFKDIKNGDLLDELITKIEKAELKETTEDKAVFSYKIKTEGGKAIIGDKEISVPAGIYTQTITVGINMNGIWKIVSM